MSVFASSPGRGSRAGLWQYIGDIAGNGLAGKRRAAKRGPVFGIIVFSLFAVLAGLWGGLALAVRGPQPARRALAAGWGALVLLALAGAWSRHWAWIAPFLPGAAALAWWWRGVRPTNDRAWQAEVSRLMSGRVEGDAMVIDNVRNFAWRGPDDFDERWETRRYDLSRLESVDMALSYWGREAVAHTMVSFGFGRGEYLVFSVEIRRKQGEKFSELGGFFRQYELSIVAATEEDCLRVRTNVRGEDGYLYRVAMPIEAARALLLSYVATANRLVGAPRFYNTVTANCTTIVYRMVALIVPGMPLDYRLLLSGYLPEYLHKLGALQGSGSMAQRRAQARYTERAKAAGPRDSYSARIRTHIRPQA